jgi:probable rRNA maturation factor
VSIDIEVEDEAWTAALPAVEAVVERAARAALAHGDVAPDAALTVLLTSDEAVRALNARFRGKDAPTNVLSFPAPETAAPFLGDIALARGICVVEAQAQGKPLEHHLTHLVAHGVLHLLGWDHETDDEAEAMEGLERRILAEMDIPDPYGSPDGTA